MLPADAARRHDFSTWGVASSRSWWPRPAEKPDVPVLLLEAGGADDAREFTARLLWPKDFGSELDWAFTAQTTAPLKGRSTALSSGHVLRDG
jgi:choline dehydrogenase